MQGFGYRIVPVRPAVSEVLGEKAYATLSDIPEKVDMVDVFRAGDQIDPIIDECIALGIPRLWLQDGVINEAAAERARAAGITVVMDRCVWRDYMDLLP
ncbi:MAG: CoA-binding protein, partial [Zoogloea sp.]|nr:CoA-binding protein [Zoogloea sp.]